MLNSTLIAQRALDVQATESGGPLMPEQAAYDVVFYDINLATDPAQEWIGGSVTTHARIVHSNKCFILNLNTLLTVSTVHVLADDGRMLREGFERRGWKLWIPFGRTMQPDEYTRVRVNYAGNPQVAPHPPWVGTSPD
jgi:hypothetical protein